MEGRALSRPYNAGAVAPCILGTPQRASLQEMTGKPSGRQHPVHQPVHKRFDQTATVVLTICSKRRKSIFPNRKRTRFPERAGLGLFVGPLIARTAGSKASRLPPQGEPQ